MLMQRAESCEKFGKSFDKQRPRLCIIGSGQDAYLWVGGLGGPCYATLAGQRKLRQLARQILEAVGPEKGCRS